MMSHQNEPIPEKEILARRKKFRALHESGCFVMPNPWDQGTAYCLQTYGFPALATTSAGFAFSQGLPDSATVLTRDMVLAHVTEIVRATVLPVNADFQAGYASDADGVAENVLKCIETGVAGLSIEDATGDPNRPLYELPEAVDRIRAARSAIDSSGADVLLTARAECFLVGHDNPLHESIRRLCAYSEAGADVLFSPGTSDQSEIVAILDDVAPKPVNVLLTSGAGLRVSDLAELGVRRISVGSALARAAWAGFLRATEELVKSGTFAVAEPAASFDTLNQLFGHAT